MGAAGRDFHNFNVVYRDDPGSEVVAFTATQIPFISDRRYPPELAGAHYPTGSRSTTSPSFARLIRDRQVQDVVFAYSDVSHEYVMHKASEVLAAGATSPCSAPRRPCCRRRFPWSRCAPCAPGPARAKPHGPSPGPWSAVGKRVVAVRHPMPYGDLDASGCSASRRLADLDRAGVTVEEREEYEEHVDSGTVVYAGVDYGDILHQAEQECDVLFWDGGNNDLPFYRPTVHIVVVDPLRAGHETSYHPGEANLRMADVVVINKMDSASPEQLGEVHDAIQRVNPARR